MKIAVSARAKSDLVAIADYVARDNPGAANDLVVQITQSLRSLADSPNRGRPGRVSGTRELLVARSYIAAYKVEPNQVTILTVRHAARLWPDEFD